MKRATIAILTPLICLITIHLTLAVAVASPVVDGNLADWGLNPSTNDWTPNPGVGSVVENSTSWSVEPGVGGQQFDAEAMYACYSEDNGGTLYVSIVTGTPSAGAVYNGETYAPGDLGIDFNGDGSFEVGIETTGNGLYDTGSIVLMGDGDWGEPSSFPSSEPFDIKGGTDTGINANIAYNNLFYGGKGYNNHYVIEMAIPIAAFGDLWGSDLTLHWTMECGNDVVELNYSPPVPEPSTSLLFGFGIIGVAAVFWKKTRTQRHSPA